MTAVSLGVGALLPMGGAWAGGTLAEASARGHNISIAVDAPIAGGRERSWGLAFAAKTTSDFRRRGAFEEQVDSLTQVFAGRFDGISLTCHVDLGAEGDIARILAANHGGELFAHHSAKYRCHAAIAWAARTNPFEGANQEYIGLLSANGRERPGRNDPRCPIHRRGGSSASAPRHSRTAPKHSQGAAIRLGNLHDDSANVKSSIVQIYKLEI